MNHITVETNLTFEDFEERESRETRDRDRLTKRDRETRDLSSQYLDCRSRGVVALLHFERKRRKRILEISDCV